MYMCWEGGGVVGERGVVVLVYLFIHLFMCLYFSFFVVYFSSIND